MRIRTALMGTAVTLLLCAHLRAQETVSKPGQPPKPIVAGLENKETAPSRKQALEEVRAMPNRVLRFQDSQLKIRTIITLAEVLWTKGKDEPEARLLFLKADELIRSVRLSKDDDSALGQEKEREVAAVNPSVLRSLKSLLVQKVSAFDAVLGQRLSREYGLGDGSLADTAYQDNFAVSGMITQGQIASASKALQNRINDNLTGRMPLHGFLNLLFELRAKDPPAADRVFIEAMVRMSGQPIVTADDVLIIGSYLFGSRGLGAANLTGPRFLGTSQIQLGGVVVQSDIALARPGNSTAATHTYIGTATQILGRGSNDPDEMKRRSAAAYLLRPHAQAFAPEFVPQLLSIERGPGIDYSAPAPTNRLQLTKGKVDLNAVMAAVDAIPTSKFRDEYILKTFRTLYSMGELDAASAVCEKMDDLNVREQLVSLITFARAAKSLEASQIEAAEKGINNVTSSLQRFLLRLGLARLYLKDHDELAAESLLTEAIKDSRDDGDTLQQPYLILSAVEMLASFNVSAAIDRLPDAMKAFNALGKRRAQTGPTFRETVKLGGSSAAFDLRLSGVSYGGFQRALKPLSSDAQGVRAVLFELKDEDLLSAAMIAFAYAFL